MFDLIIPVLLAIAMCITMYTDVTRYIIPNWLVLGVLILYPIWVMTAPLPVDWTMGLAMAGGLLLIGFVLFTFGILGAGDAKLLTALGLFAGWSMAGLEFVLNMALIGGALAIILVTLRKMYKYKDNTPKILTPKSPAPYGIAIAISFLIHLAYGKIPGMTGGLL